MFNSLGRAVPELNSRVFSPDGRTFYKLRQGYSVEDYMTLHSKANSYNLIGSNINATDVEIQLNLLKEEINSSKILQNVLCGPMVPFALNTASFKKDLGQQLEQDFLKRVQKSFENHFPNSRFRGTLQGKSTLSGNLNCCKYSGYDDFVFASQSGVVLGFYFPTAFQEYDINSQRARAATIISQSDLNICLSGSIESSYALIVSPNLLSDRDSYSPILCMSAVEYSDPRMVPVYKSYGPHLEFWLLSQMMSPGQTQVSEQWAGGLTIYRQI